MTSDIKNVLSQEQLATYRRDGYILLPEVFSAAEVRRMRIAADHMLELLINASLATGEMNPRLDLRTRKDGKKIVRKVQPVNDIGEYLRTVSEDQRLVQPMRDILASEPVVMEEKLLYKQVIPEAISLTARPDDDAFDVHHDWGAYRAQGYPTETLSVAVALDDLKPEKGTLCFFVGSHRRDFPLELNYTTLNSPRIDDVLKALGVASLDDAVSIIAPPGSVLIFHGLIVHYSRSNQSDEPRRLMIYSYHPSWFEIEPDKRNRPTRERAQANEQKYRNLVAAGSYHDLWRATDH